MPNWCHGEHGEVPGDSTVCDCSFPSSTEWPKFKEDGIEIQLSPSVLGSFAAIEDPDSPWMTPEKFATRLMQMEPMSDAADAGNAVHDAAFDHGLTIHPDFSWDRAGHFIITQPGVPEAWSHQSGRLEITTKDGGSWWVDPEVIYAIRQEVPLFGSGLAEVPRLLSSEELGVEGVRSSMRADYLTRPRWIELKSTKTIKAMRYIRSAQRYAYSVAFGIPGKFVLAQVKITTPRGRPDHIKGSIALSRVESHAIEPDPSDLPILQDMMRRCRDYLRQFRLLLAHVQQKQPPSLL